MGNHQRAKAFFELAASEKGPQAGESLKMKRERLGQLGPDRASPQQWSGQQNGVRVGESQVNFQTNFADQRSRDSVYDVFVPRRKRVHTDAKFD